MARTTLLIMAILILSVACGHKDDSRLIHISGMVSEASEEALRLLDEINEEDLAGSDRHLYQLLRVKALDKGDRPLPSDSIICEVIDFYSREKGSFRYAESLYYGGRVYCEEGDYPTALQYFQKAINELPEKREYKVLRSTWIGQLASVLLKIKLYQHAVPYIKSAIRLDKEENDTIALYEDLNLLAWTYRYEGKNDSAKSIFKEVVETYGSAPDRNGRIARINLSSIYRNEGNIDSALSIIRSVPLYGDSLIENFALSEAAFTYREAGMTDSAYILAKKIIGSPNRNNRTTGYKILLSERIAPLLPADSVLPYAMRYRALIDSAYNQNNAEAVMMQQTLYNYRRHLELREKAESSNRTLMVIIGCCLVVSMGLTIVILYLKNRNNKQYIELQAAISKLERFNDSTSGSPAPEASPTSYDESVSSEEAPLGRETGEGYNVASRIADLSSFSRSMDELKEIYCRQLLGLEPDGGVRKAAVERMCGCRAYSVIKSSLSRMSPIPLSKPVWRELQNHADGSNHEFSKNIERLGGKRIAKEDLVLILLVKCGLTQTQCATILSKTPSAISYQRQRVSEKFFGKELSAAQFDFIISIL